MGYMDENRVAELWEKIKTKFALKEDLNNKVETESGKGLSTNDYTDSEKEKLAGIAEGATHITVDAELSIDSGNPVQNKALTNKITVIDGLLEQLEKQKATLAQLTQILTDAKIYADATYQQSTGYTDQKIADLINGAPSTMDTLKEIADVVADNKSVVDSLEAAIGSKAEAVELDTHMDNTTVHVTQTERGRWDAKLDKTGDISDAITTFKAGSTLTTLISKEKISVSFGKVAKAISALINHISTDASADVLGHVKVDDRLSTTSTNPVQNKVIDAALTRMQTSFQDGCDTLYNTCVDCGVTPGLKTPTGIANAIWGIKDNALHTGTAKVKIASFTKSTKFTINKPWAVAEINNDFDFGVVRRILGYLVYNGSVGCMALLERTNYNLMHGEQVNYVYASWHPSNGCSAALKEGYISRYDDTSEVATTSCVISHTLFTIHKFVNGNCSIGVGGDYWRGQTNTSDKNFVIIYEEE